MDLVDLAYSDDEMKGETKVAPAPPNYTGPKYPWGLELRLEDASLKKLGMDASDFEVGAEIPFGALGIVTSISMSEHQDGTKYQCVTLVVAGLALGEEESTDEEKADKFYKS